MIHSAARRAKLLLQHNNHIMNLHDTFTVYSSLYEEYIWGEKHLSKDELYLQPETPAFQVFRGAHLVLRISTNYIFSHIADITDRTDVWQMRVQLAF